LRFLIALALLVGLMSSACWVGTGTYPVEVFSEMHYSQAYRSNEAPRLAPPEGAVPRSARAPRATGAGLYHANCSMCHGFTGRGDGPVLARMISQYSYVPAMDVNLRGPRVQDLPDDAIGSLISNGVVVMPAFQGLLTPEEISLLVQHIRTLRE
jgi:mono/diheme cytochrome c family protein